MAAFDAARLDQPVAVFIAEGGNVDDRKRVGGFQPDARSGRHCLQTATGLQHRKRAFQPAQIVALGFAQSNGFPHRRPFLAPSPGGSAMRAAASIDAVSPASVSAVKALATGAGTGAATGAGTAAATGAGTGTGAAAS